METGTQAIDFFLQQLYKFSNTLLYDTLNNLIINKTDGQSINPLLIQ